MIMSPATADAQNWACMCSFLHNTVPISPCGAALKILIKSRASKKECLDHMYYILNPES
jgi:hypothetical protein